METNNKRGKEANVVCSFCLKKFYKSPSKIKNSKSGLYFCCREHKDIAQKLSSGLTEIHPPHYGTGVGLYRKKAFEFKEKVCNRCGFDKYPEILQVHHIDRNFHNSDINNLEILCPNCHETDHFLKKDGRFSSKNGAYPEGRAFDLQSK